MTVEERLESVVSEVQAEYAPDPRTAVFEVEVERDGDALRLLGAVSDPAAVEALHRRVAVLGAGVTLEDLIERLPRPGAEQPHAVVTAPIAPMLADPLVAAAHVSQALLGHHLLVLRERGRWLHCRADDGYLGWVHRGYVRRLDETEARAWTVGAGGVAALSLGARLLDPGGALLAPLPWGSRVLALGDGLVALPDGTTGVPDGEILPLAEQPLRFPREGRAVVETAARWMGAPYIWGGTTPAGVDCSGLVQSVYRTHGMELPRDSDQQARMGEAIDVAQGFDGLLPGDLLFFAEEPGRVTHVTLSTGGSQILHSSLGNGGVRRNDLAGALPFERELRRLFVCARRVLSAGS